MKRFFIFLRCFLTGHNFVSNEWNQIEYDEDYFYSNLCKKCDVYICCDNKKQLPKGHKIKTK